MSILTGTEVIEHARSNDKTVFLHMSLQHSALLTREGEYHNRNNIVIRKTAVDESNNHERNNEPDLADEETSIVAWVAMSDCSHDMGMFLGSPDILGARI